MYKIALYNLKGITYVIRYVKAYVGAGEFFMGNVSYHNKVIAFSFLENNDSDVVCFLPCIVDNDIKILIITGIITNEKSSELNNEWDRLAWTRNGIF